MAPLLLSHERLRYVTSRKHSIQWLGKADRSPENGASDGGSMAPLSDLADLADLSERRLKGILIACAECHTAPHTKPEKPEGYQ